MEDFLKIFELRGYSSKLTTVNFMIILDFY